MKIAELFYISACCIVWVIVVVLNLSVCLSVLMVCLACENFARELFCLYYNTILHKIFITYVSHYHHHGPTLLDPD